MIFFTSWFGTNSDLINNIVIICNFFFSVQTEYNNNDCSFIIPNLKIKNT